MATATPPSRIHRLLFKAPAAPGAGGAPDGARDGAGDGPDRSPDLLGAPPRRAGGGRRANRRPLVFAFAVLVLAVGAFTWSVLQRTAKRRQRPDAAAEVTTAAQAAPLPTFAGEPAVGVIPAAGADGADPISGSPAPAAGDAAFDPNYGRPGAGATGPADAADGGPPAALRDQARTQGWQEYQQEVSELRRARHQAALEALGAKTRVDAGRGVGGSYAAAAPAGAGVPGVGGDDGAAAVLRALAAAAGGQAAPGANALGMPGGAPGAEALAGGALAGAGADAEGDPNGQVAKQAFAAQTGRWGPARAGAGASVAAAGAFGTSRVDPGATTLLQAGTVIPAVLVGGINSDLPGQVVAQVSEPVYDGLAGRQVVVPQGAKLLGTYSSSVSAGQQRVQVAWTRVTYPDGSTLDLGGMPGVDQAGSAGFRDRVDNHYRRTFGSALLLSAFSAGVQLSQPQATNGMNFNSGQIVAGAMGQQLGQLGMETARRNMLVQPRLEIRPGYRFNVVVTRDLPVRPWGAP